jgi:hypothetical protein
VPVLLLTGAFETLDEQQLISSGANGVLEKPLDKAVVISRVKELLGFRAEPNPRPAAGRLLTPPAPGTDRAGRRAAAPDPSRPAPASRDEAAAAWDRLRRESGLGPEARSVESPRFTGRSGEGFGVLDDAFESLDAQIAGHPSPAGSGAVGPGRTSAASRASDPVFEVDDQWFAASDAAAAERRADARNLAAEMGIHDVELPERVDDPSIRPRPASRPAAGPRPVGSADRERPGGAAGSPAGEPGPTIPVAETFASILAVEQGEAGHVAPQQIVVQAPAPEITDQMLESVSARLAVKLQPDLIRGQYHRARRGAGNRARRDRGFRERCGDGHRA